MNTHEQMKRGRWIVPVAASGLLSAACPGQAVIYVDDSAAPGGDGSSWATALDSLSAGLAGADDGDEVRAGAGLYRPAGPGGDRNARFEVAPGVLLIGGYAGAGGSNPDDRDPRTFETILCGDLDGDDEPGFVNRSDNVYNVVYLDSPTPGTAVEGFTIRGGHADGILIQDAGGGIHSLFGLPTIRDCVFRDNYSIFQGGALRIAQAFDDGSEPAVVDRCAFYGNRTQAVGGSGGGAMEAANTTIIISNSIFAGNVSDLQGGAIVNNADMTVTNCTIFANEAANLAGGIYNNSADLTVLNSILWGNTSSSSVTEREQFFQFAGERRFEHCLIEGLDALAGNDNIGAAPQFVDMAGADGVAGTVDDDLRFSAGSPAIDAGDDMFVEGELDIDGLLRIAGPRVDIGAHEFGSSAPPEGCPADLDGDGQVSSSDLGTLLGMWGAADGSGADLDDDGVVGSGDLAAMLGDWGPCS